MKAKPVRVLNIVGSLDLAGTEQYIVRVAPRLRQYGIEIEICALERRGHLISVAEAEGVRVHGTHARSHMSRTLAYAGVRTVFEIASLIRHGRFDIVHSYLFHAEIIGTPAAKLAGTRRIIISRRAIHPRRPLGASFLLLETVTNVFADELIANSFTVLRDTERTERLLPRTRTVIYNGVDPSRYELAAPRSSGPLRIVTVGALAARKGQEFAIRALRLVRDAGVDARVTVVGGGPDEDALRRVAKEQGVESQIVFAGVQSDPRPYLLEADVFVLPSRQEGFSNALLEAMASGLPVVATNVGGNSEAVVDGEGGAIVAPLDEGALAGALISMAKSRDQLPDMGRANRRRVEDVFSLDASVRNLAHWYRREEDVSPEPNIGA